MTKAAELKVLDAAIAQLGTESYLGPWLTSVRAEVASLIYSDFAPTMLPSEAYKQAAAIVADATVAATQAKATAAAVSNSMIDEAASRIDAAKQRARQQLETLARELR